MATGLIFAVTLVLAESVPANAYFVDTPRESAAKLAIARGEGPATITTTSRGQVYVSKSVADGDTTARDDYAVISVDPRAAAFTDRPGANVRWPFAATVPISSGFGGRLVANCRFCSTTHLGLDFAPGAGTTIQSIAAGVVSKVVEGGTLGYNVWIDHTVDGRPVTSVYAHMQAGSVRVKVGQSVTPGQPVGLVGSTGNSTGPHLHLEIHAGSTPVDPLAWLQANAGRR